MPKLGTKNPLCGCFWPKIFKSYWHTRNQHPQICIIAKFVEKKPPYLGTQNTLPGYFELKF